MYTMVTRGFLSLLVGLAILAGCEQKEKERKAVISTNLGDITILLYNSTPKHRDNFIKLVESGFYDSLLFHRVIPHFMIQGGDPLSKNAPREKQLGSGNTGEYIEAEIGAPHIRGALAAARPANPKKESSGCQFYIVTGKKLTSEELDRFELEKNIKYNEAQRKLYLEEGGYPYLDMEYTVFGEVLSGMDVADQISRLERDEKDRPLTDIRMHIKMID